MSFHRFMKHRRLLELMTDHNPTTEIERLAKEIADEIVPYECNRNDDLRALLLKFAKEVRLASIEGEFR